MNSYNCCSTSNTNSKDVINLSETLKLVGENNRLRILCILSQGTHCVCEINDHIPASQSLISHHLKDLKNGGLIYDEKKGLNVFYSLTAEGKRITNLLLEIPKQIRK